MFTFPMFWSIDTGYGHGGWNFNPYNVMYILSRNYMMVIYKHYRWLSKDATSDSFRFFDLFDRTKMFDRKGIG